MKRGLPDREVAIAEEVLSSETLTIGFARRFAPYKRADLILRDIERLERILTNEKYPAQIILAGKAHPQDNMGKELIKKLVQTASKDSIRRHMVFLEDYDMATTRYLVQGTDVWLNTPTRPREASGTSGMKASANGVLNLSILDGWWDEAYQPEVGWAIGRRETYADRSLQDQVEAEALYGILEREVMAMFYDRGPDGLPRRWIERMKAAMRSICPTFNTNRMVHEYAERFYVPAARRFARLTDHQLAKAKQLADYLALLRAEWAKLRIETVETESVEELPVGSELKVRARVRLGTLAPEQVAVQLFEGLLDPDGNIIDAEVVPMAPDTDGGDGVRDFVGSIVCRTSGQHGFSVRVVPHHEDLSSPFHTGLIVWK